MFGISYVIWALKLNQTNFNIVNSSCLKLNLINEKNDINVENAYPLLNEEGVQRLSNFDTVESTLKNISISKELYKGGIGAGETNNYKLRLWLSEDVGPEDIEAMNKLFNAKVTVTASAGIYV